MLSVSTQIAPEDSLSQLAELLESVKFASEIVIYNFGRRDDEFIQLSDEYQAKVIELAKPYPPIVEQIRSREVRESTGDWVLVMDYDEVVTPELQQEISKVIGNNSPTGPSTYAIPRRNFSLGYPLSHGGFGDDYVIRLFRRKDFLDWPTNIHSTPTFLGSLGKLKSYMEHHKDATLSQMVAKTNRYSEIEAQQFFDGGLPPVTPFTLVRKSTMEFIRRYVLKKGFLDGRIGLIQAIYQGYSVFISYAKLFELQQKLSKVKKNI